MQALTNAGLLNLWERGQALHPLDRGLLALSAAQPQVSLEALADLPLGERNRALAELHAASFGARLAAGVACPQCAEPLEFELDCLELTATHGTPSASLMVDGETFRLPSSRDLAQASREPDADAGARRLVERCRLNPAPGPLAWSAEQLVAVGEQMALADPLAETRLALDCPGCGHRWNELLDLAAFLWSQIEAAVKRLLLDVHALARAYGWSEAQIFTLSDQRRALYLEMVRA